MKRKILFFLMIASMFASGCTSLKDIQFESFLYNDTVYFNDFEDSPLGNYTNKEISKEWRGAKKLDYEATCKTRIMEDENGNRFLRVSHPKGKYGVVDAGLQFFMELERSRERYCSYGLRPSENIDFGLGFKLPGLIGMLGDEMASGGVLANGTNSWTYRLMTASRGRIKAYLYPMYKKAAWGDAYSFNHDLHEGDYCYLIPGQWNYVQLYVRMNTIGKKDGVIKGWFNGKLVCEISGLSFRTIPELAIDKFYFSNFYGGNDKDWAPEVDGYIDFDNFVISKKSIVPYLIK